MIEKVEALIVGAGVIGSSVAMHLSKLGLDGIRVIDIDLEGSLSSSELNAGGVRATWHHPLNIELSRSSIEYFESVSEQVGYRSCGYLWLRSPEQWSASLHGREIQVRHGWPVEVWDPDEIRRRIPFLDKLEGIEGAIFAPRDGLVNSNLLKSHYRAEARKRGVVFEDRTLLRQAEIDRSGSHRVHAVAERFEPQIGVEDKRKILTLVEDVPSSRSALTEYRAKRIINCGGPWASWIATMIGYSCPSYATRRQVSLFSCRNLDLTPYGMIVDTSGVYFHPEGTGGLAGYADRNEKKGAFNFEYDGDSFFTELIWPSLYERSTFFEHLKHVSGWAGAYEVSPDESAIIGEVVWGDHEKSGLCFEAHSFSGHGVMQSYSAGQILAEKILYGKFMSLDGEIFSGRRFELNKRIEENLFI